MDNPIRSVARLQAHRWRYFLILAVLFTSLSSASLRTASAEGSADSVITSYATRFTHEESLASQHSLLSTPQSPDLQAKSDNPVPAPAEISTGRFRYFTETAHFLRGIFLTYWETHGATAILGLPLTEALMEDGMAVQYLERARLEWHPENAEVRNQVLLARLGAVTLEARGVQFPQQPEGANTPTSHFFAETGHNLGSGFLSFWLKNGGLAVFGYPLSEEVVEINEADGQQYTVQYFERNRFEWHPERNSANDVQLGLLGTEYARMEGLNPLSRILLPGPFVGSEEDQSDSPELAALVDEGLLPSVQMLGRTPQFKWVPGLIIKNNISLRFEEIEDEDVAGAFIVTGNRTRRYAIIIPETERDAPAEVIASVLAHESTHAFNTITGVPPTRGDCSIEEETRAFMNGLAAWLILRGDDALSQSYPARSFASAINNSLRRFNGNSTELSFNFNPQAGRDYLRVIYGSECEAWRTVDDRR
jgi:hypothetical protein